ncbi:hypothetical protein [Amycolatopsis sp. NBC_01480]|uniref:hypothetical protein n=1 Tax=Amycolatopsis sp. NBC_01480 TaxID=2903562 RepID=UPI002E2A39D6|nr:hypothetical protein [Amycolatopsis sp. NBC_01480]
MSEEQEKTSGQDAKKGLRLTPVLAAALAAVTAALLGSTLGVAGTVVGAGVASIVTTVGGELYLRSLQRTRDAALKARSVLATAGQRRGTNGGGLEPVEDPAQMPTMYMSTRIPADPSEMPTVRISKLTGPQDTSAGETEPEPAGSFVDKLRKLRWPLIIGTSVVATAIAIVFMLGLEGATNGKAGAGFYHSNPGTSQQQNRQDTAPTTSQNTAPPTETSSSTPTSSQAPTSSSTPSTSPSTDSNPPSSSVPSTGTSQPQTSQPQSKAAVPTNANP